jgi:hypothetical protein
MVPSKPPTNLKFQQFFSKFIIDLFVVELLLKHGSTATMQQNLEILDVLMSTTSCSNTTNVWEKAHAFKNPSPHSPCKNPKKLEWEFNRVFKDVWATKLPWAKAIISLNGKLLMVRCKI